MVLGGGWCQWELERLSGPGQHPVFAQLWERCSAPQEISNQGTGFMAGCAGVRPQGLTAPLTQGSAPPEHSSAMHTTCRPRGSCSVARLRSMSSTQSGMWRDGERRLSRQEPNGQHCARCPAGGTWRGSLSGRRRAEPLTGGIKHAKWCRFSRSLQIFEDGKRRNIDPCFKCSGSSRAAVGMHRGGHASQQPPQLRSRKENAQLLTRSHPLAAARRGELLLLLLLLPRCSGKRQHPAVTARRALPRCLAHRELQSWREAPPRESRM